MESFIYADLNRASREKDESKIQYYGAFAATLSYIIYFANMNRRNDEKLVGSTKLYRGLKMKQEELDSLYTKDSKVRLMGYTSTSKKYSKALGFALANLKQE